MVVAEVVTLAPHRAHLHDYVYIVFRRCLRFGAVIVIFYDRVHRYRRKIYAFSAYRVAHRYIIRSLCVRRKRYSRLHKPVVHIQIHGMAFKIRNQLKIVHYVFKLLIKFRRRTLAGEICKALVRCGNTGYLLFAVIYAYFESVSAFRHTQIKIRRRFSRFSRIAFTNLLISAKFKHCIKYLCCALYISPVLAHCNGGLQKLLEHLVAPVDTHHIYHESAFCFVISTHNEVVYLRYRRYERNIFRYAFAVDIHAFDCLPIHVKIKFYVIIVVVFVVFECSNRSLRSKQLYISVRKRKAHDFLIITAQHPFRTVRIRLKFQANIHESFAVCHILKLTFENYGQNIAVVLNYRSYIAPVYESARQILIPPGKPSLAG